MKDHGDFLSEYVSRRQVTKWPVKSYLEIGCQNDGCFNRICVEQKVGIDPISGGTIRTTSDEFFERSRWDHQRTRKLQYSFDLVFIDGDHSHLQVMRDVSNSYKHMSPLHGLIALHDCLPPNEHYTAGNLCHDSYRAFLACAEIFEAVLIPEDFGIGLLRRLGQSQQPFCLDKYPGDISYESFKKDYLPKITQLNFEQAIEWSMENLQNEK